MNLLTVQGNLSKASELIESAYHLLEDIPTVTDIETATKDKLLTRLKNNLVDCVILVDIVNEINQNPNDETTLEAILDLVSDAEEMLS